MLVGGTAAHQVLTWLYNIISTFEEQTCCSANLVEVTFKLICVIYLYIFNYIYMINMQIYHVYIWDLKSQHDYKMMINFHVDAIWCLFSLIVSDVYSEQCLLYRNIYNLPVCSTCAHLSWWYIFILSGFMYILFLLLDILRCII